MTFTEILADARRWVGDSATGYSTANITASANRALERVTTLIRQSEGRWQWDDSNHTDFPFSTTTLTADQQDYTLDPTHYRIERVEVKDTQGTWTKLVPFDQKDIVGESLTDFQDGTGLPRLYDKVGHSILLYPTPDYTQAASLKVFYQRGPSYFAVDDTTKTPGFNPLFHRLVSMWAAYDFASIADASLAKNIRGEIALMEEDLKEEYSLRDRDEHIRLEARRINFR